MNTSEGASLVGFRLAGEELVRIEGGAHSLPAGADPALVAFSPDGLALLVTDRAADAIHVVRLDAMRRVVEIATSASSGATRIPATCTAGRFRTTGLSPRSARRTVSH